ncbi:MAG: alpha/beta hydrolase [Saprospiraceae bacterium]|nr:alpha/beta hydrolase [Saprospiraceae bacterium]
MTLLLHGALGTSKQFERLIQQLGPDGRVDAINFSGHGGKVSSGQFSMEVFMEDLLNYLDENKVDKVDVFGYSMGGYVALYTALRHPDRIGRIVTLGTKFDWTPESAAKETRMLNPDKIEEKVPAFAAKLQKDHAPLDWKVVLQQTSAMMLELGNGNGLSWDVLPNIHHEVHICLGDHDNMVSQEESEKAAGLLPNGTFTLLEGVPHPIEKVDVKVLVDIVNR